MPMELQSAGGSAPASARRARHLHTVASKRPGKKKHWQRGAPRGSNSTVAVVWCHGPRLPAHLVPSGSGRPWLRARRSMTNGPEHGPRPRAGQCKRGHPLPLLSPVPTSDKKIRAKSKTPPTPAGTRTTCAVNSSGADERGGVATSSRIRRGPGGRRRDREGLCRKFDCPSRLPCPG